MIDLKSRNNKVDEMSQNSSFFLCPEPSARHLDAFQVCKLGAMTQSARHLTVASASLSHQAIYMGGRNITINVKTVIPAKAGIQKYLRMDPRIREDDTRESGDDNEAKLYFSLSYCADHKQVSEHA